MTPRYKPYPEYKPSGLPACGNAQAGVEWLGEVPEGWGVSRIKFIAKLNPSKEKVRLLSKETMVTFLPMESIGEKGEIDASRTKRIDDVLNGYTYVSENDVIIAKITPCFENGKGAVARDLKNEIAFATTEVIPLSCNRSPDSQFLYYLLYADPFHSNAEGSMYGAGGQKRVSDSFVANYSFALPTPKERDAIASFLDRETGKIDRLIEKQERMIKLLKEKRQAVISHAVTKGLNPNAPMKDSGVEWLGEIPEHWGVQSVKAVAQVGNGSTPKRENTHYWEDGTYPWLNSSVVNQEQVTKSDQFVTEQALSECHLPKLKPPIILIGITGQGKTRGLATTLLCEATINQHVAYVKVRSKLVSVKYLRRMFDMAYSFLRYESEGGGSTKGAITCDQIKTLKFPFAPYREQNEIVQYLETETTKIDHLISKAEQAIELMKERRTALVSAAVTGKIDVRERGNGEC